MEKQEVAEFFNQRAAEWDSFQIRDEQKLERIFAAADIHKGCRVLDIACGTGVLFPDYLRLGCTEIVGVDISKEMCLIAAEKFKNDHVTVLNIPAEELDFPQHFDRCMIYNSFPHFVDQRLLLEVLARQLMPGGRLTIAHSMSREHMNHHHSSAEAAKVSQQLESAENTAELFAGLFSVDHIISDESIYLVSGVKK